jgi:transcription antitermination factor NusG
MKWYVLYTRHHHERAVYERVLSKGFQSYLPLAMIWRKSRDGPRKVLTPLFPRHVFVRCYLEMYAHLELISIRGAMRLLENAQGQFLVVPDEEIRLLRQLINGGVLLELGTYQVEGERVEVVKGLLQGISGIIREETRTTLHVPIHALRVCVAVEIGQAQVIPCSDDEGESPHPKLLPPGLIADW